MTQKEVTNILYDAIPDAGRVDTVESNSRYFYVYKSDSEEIYMACELNDHLPSYNSRVYTNIQDCYDWITEKINLENS